MPKKTKATTKVSNNNPSPTQSQLARLISDSFDVFESDLMSHLVEVNNNDSMGLSRDNLVTIRDTVKKNAQAAREKTINNLLTYYS